MPALAHVKWFAVYDLAAAPRPLPELWSPAFGELALLSVLAICAASRIEVTGVGTALLSGLDRLTTGLRVGTEQFMRTALAIFFTALWVNGSFILTPELGTTDPAVAWFQAAIAVGLLWRRTMLFSGLGIAYLYVLGTESYGVFHMMDYPIFLSVAAYFVLTGLGRTLFELRPIDVVRWGTAITLMWASVEKWAYPDWTYPLLKAKAHLTMGLSPDFFMTASGLVEFGLAFGLVCTPLVRRLSAVTLASIFVSAVFEFGKMDAIGHLPIIAVLVALAVDNAPAERRPIALVPAWYCAALAAFVVVYYSAHVLFQHVPAT
ncbi:MAG TPA: hypothetical protein VGC80_10140 [Acetobacteraceae bacterium]